MPLPWYGARVKVLWGGEHLYEGPMLEDENVRGTLTDGVQRTPFIGFRCVKDVE
ncbi:MAG: hypothetical protein J7M24_07355 [Candidatus Latescibacteria bacterium]|nr:hypothetical protein [Candidatus Latescibacterota bacterium]